MDNVNIEGINNISMVKELFSKVNCLEDDNCILVVINRDYGTTSSAGDILTTNATVVGTKNGGVAGGIIGGAIASSINSTVQQAVTEFNSKLNDKQKIIFNTNTYCGYLINIISSGIGVIPLKNNGQLIPKIKDFKTDIDNYVFFGNDEIEKVELQKLPLHFSSKKLAIYFENLGDIPTPWLLPKDHKLLSYQKDNFNKLVNDILGKFKN